MQDAVFSMHSDKFPILDGMNAGFFQAYWDIILGGGGGGGGGVGEAERRLQMLVFRR